MYRIHLHVVCEYVCVCMLLHARTGANVEGGGWATLSVALTPTLFETRSLLFTAAQGELAGRRVSEVLCLCLPTVSLWPWSHRMCPYLLWLEWVWRLKLRPSCVYCQSVSPKPPLQACSFDAEGLTNWSRFHSNTSVHILLCPHLQGSEVPRLRHPPWSAVLRQPCQIHFVVIVIHELRNEKDGWDFSRLLECGKHLKIIHTAKIWQNYTNSTLLTSWAFYSTHVLVKKRVALDTALPPSKMRQHDGSWWSTDMAVTSACWCCPSNCRAVCVLFCSENKCLLISVLD